MQQHEGAFLTEARFAVLALLWTQWGCDPQALSSAPSICRMGHRPRDDSEQDGLGDGCPESALVGTGLELILLGQCLGCVLHTYPEAVAVVTTEEGL